MPNILSKESQANLSTLEHAIKIEVKLTSYEPVGYFVDHPEYGHYGHSARGTYFVGSKGEIIGLNLHSFDVGGRLPDIPSLFPQLRVLVLAGTGITQFDWIDQLPELQYLNLSRNADLKEIQWKKPHQNIVYFEASRSGLSKLNVPAGCVHLERIDINRSDCEIFDLGNAPSLKYLDISYNKIKQLEIPAACASIEYLFARGNQMEKFNLHEEAAKLNEINLDQNLLKELPKAIGILGKQGSLEVLYLSGNPVEGIPEGYLDTVSKNYLKDILEYLFSGDESERTQNNSANIILLGNPTVGKSVLVHALVHDAYKETVTTHGILYEPWNFKMENDDYVAYLWDFGGQEHFHATHRVFFRGHSLYLVLYNSELEYEGEKEITIIENNNGEPKSVKRTETLHKVDYWFEAISRFCRPGGKRHFLIKTKAEATGKSDISSVFKTVSVWEPQALEINVRDAFQMKHRNEVVTGRFLHLKEQLMLGIQEINAGYSIRPEWLKFRDLIDQKWKMDLEVSWSEFKDLAMNEEVSGLPELASWLREDVDNLKLMCKWLDHVSSITWFEDHQELSGWIYPNPQILARAIYLVLNENVRNRGGIFNFSHAVTALKELNLEDDGVRRLLTVMKRLELVYSPESTPNLYVAPQYLASIDLLRESLPFSTLSIANTSAVTSFLVLKFKFTNALTKSVLNRLMVHFEPSIGNAWRGGFFKVLRFINHSEDLKPLIYRIEDNPAEKCIAVYCTPDAGSDTFLRDLLLEVDKLTKGEDILVQFDEVNTLRLSALSIVIKENRVGVQLENLAKNGNPLIEWQFLREKLHLLTETNAQFIPSNGLEKNPEAIDIPQVAISYAHKYPDSSEADDFLEPHVHKIVARLKDEIGEVVMDKTHLKEHASILNFMGDIGSRSVVVFFVSEKFLKSEYCIGEFFAKVHNVMNSLGILQYKMPKILFDEKFKEAFKSAVLLYKVDGQLSFGKGLEEIEQYWKDKFNKLNRGMKHDTHEYLIVKYAVEHWPQLIGLIRDNVYSELMDHQEMDYKKVVEDVSIRLKSKARMV